MAELLAPRTQAPRFWSCRMLDSTGKFTSRHTPCSLISGKSSIGTRRGIADVAVGLTSGVQSMATDVDIYVGKRLRRRRRLLGMTQQDLANEVGVRFQQIQKYECGANRITASRLFDLANALTVNVNYFFDGLAADGTLAPANDGPEMIAGDVLSQKETLELVRAYYRLSERPRRRLLELAKALEEEATESGAA
tara:strand:- start:169 stop:750 length:582 start_codon:yes stop_codon:yes gene_type:complete